MKLIARNNCPICKSFSTQLIYKLSYKDSKIKIFIQRYKKSFIF